MPARVTIFAALIRRASWAGVAVLVSSACRCLAGTVTLLPAAFVDADRALTLADIADMSGQDALDAAEVRVLSAEDLRARMGLSGSARVSLADVRAALARSRQSVSRLAISGSACDVRVLASKDPVPAEAPRPVRTVEAGPKVASALIAPTGPGGLHPAIARALVALFQVSPDQLRLTFDPRDDAFLSAAREGTSVLARPLNTSPFSGSVAVEIRLLEDGRETALKTIGVKAELLRTVARLTRTVGKRTPISESDIESIEQWVAPGAVDASGASGASDAGRMLGQLTRSRLEEGTVLTPELLVPPLAVKRNEYIEVWVYKGNLAVKARAMALKEGAVGDVIPARLDRQRAPFPVRLEGDHRAVAVGDEGT